MNGVQTRFKCKLDVKRCKRFVFPPSSLLPRSNALKTKAIRYFQTDRTLTRIVSPPLDILLNIAGGNMPGATLESDQNFYDMDISCWEKVTSLNMNGTVYPSMIFGKVMAEQKKGCIINVSSMAAYSAITRVPGYSAAKTAVANFTQWLASEMALKYGDGIRVNAIAPGFFIGDQNRRVLINPDGSLTDRSKKVLAKTPMNRFGDIKELNGAVQFLCSEAASFVTGAMLPIDGGFSAFSGV